MPDLILHHYDFSNYSEKVRLALGYKGLAWRSVTIPPVAPKPDLTPLTGGYRRTPVLQVGADIYCDTSLIVRELERRFPAPTLFPAALSASADAIVYWAENRLFRPVSLYVSGSNIDHLPQGLQTDRALMRGLPPPDAATVQRAARRNAPLVRAQIPQVDAMLADGRAWIAGPAPTVADLAVYHALWFITARTALLAHELAPYPRIAAWMSRVRDFGHGASTPLDASEALRIAATATPEAARPSQPFAEDPPLGSAVRIRADDYGRDPVEGTLVFIDPGEIAVRRDDEQTGTTVVHFPRLGYDLRPLR
ncbi:glutathione S-transferase family protein [Vineibacter terrae]|uniref:glutathione S-transferase family protein n=1 Tax=Vineibacter terrae TaxID=2586908 RepID=UPI002E37B06C|nr:glutathione S-transferase family protein [Vineibacter terrae]HEX2891557.1 glutathione S-transferase family protein [Vineibacter terrae]